MSMTQTLSPRTLKAYAIGITWLWWWVLCGLFFACVAFPGSLDSGPENHRSVTILFSHPKDRAGPVP